VTVFTVGHSTRPVEELVALLQDAGVQVLFDVRRYPGSRRHPQFSRDTLSATLRDAGIEYRHEPRMGGRRNPVPGSPNAAWRSASFRGYADHTATPEFQDALRELIEAAGTHVATVMCAEAVPWRCHRQLIADALVARGVEVVHLIGPGQRRTHELNAAAHVGVDGIVTYGAVEPLAGCIVAA
jgi:uncharacterized protein (DUF488 family)